MIHFEKTNKMANWFIAVGVLFALITFLTFINSGFYELLQYNFANDVRGSLLTVIFFIISLFFILIATAMKCIVREVNDEMIMLGERMKND